VAKFREYLPAFRVDIAVWGDGVMAIYNCSDGGDPNPVGGSNSRNFTLR
jgi:hypothetical protein